MGRKQNWKKSKRQRETRKESQGATEREYDPSTVAEVESLFKKRFIYRKPEGDSEVWELPSLTTWFSSKRWEVAALVELRDKLNIVKGSLSHLDINQWHEHTQATNRAGAVQQFVRRTRKPELCTQAWCKFYEILASFLIVTDGGPESARMLNSIHMCEAPGAFIASLNHYLQTHGGVASWQWTGNTLNPYHEANHLSQMIADDRLIFETLGQWYFGKDDTGNIMDAANIEGLHQRASDMGPIHLVTADGSVDCQNQPEGQEGIVAPLHYCEVVAGLLLLAPGGSLVLKMFTLLEDTSVCLLYLLNCAFSQVNVFKPATSKSGNSEVYLVCTGFNGLEEAMLDKLKQYTGPHLPEEVLFPLELIPDTFLREHERCCDLFVKFQTQTIEENKAMYGHMTAEVREQLNAVRACCASSFVERYQVRPLGGHQHVVPEYQMVGRHAVTSFHQIRTRKQHMGSYNERQHLSQLPWQQRIEQMPLIEVDTSHHVWLQSNYQIDEEMLRTWTYTRGCCISRVFSSQFCDSSLLQLYNELLDHHKMEPPVVDVTEVVKEISSFCVEPMDIEDVDTQLKVIVCDPSLGPLGRALQSNDNFLVSQEKISEDDVRLIVAELGLGHHGDDIAESTSKRGVLEALLSVFEVVQPGDHCVLTLPGLLTRFSAGLLFLIHASFNKLLVLPAGQQGCTPLYVIGQSHTGHPAQLHDWLKTLITMTTEVDKSQDILQLMPISNLLEKYFYAYVSTVSEAVVKSRTNHMISVQRHLIGQQLPEDHMTRR